MVGDRKENGDELELRLTRKETCNGVHCLGRGVNPIYA